MRFYRQSWFWLMLLFVLSLVNFVVKLPIRVVINNDILECISAIGTFASAAIAAGAIVFNEKIRKKKDTYDAYNNFKEKHYDFECEIDERQIRKMACLYTKNKNYLKKNKKYNKTVEYLCDMEQFATCVNNNIFDIDVVWDMGGPFIVEKYYSLQPLIQKKREYKHRNSIYEQFEEMKNKLEKKGNRKR